MFCRPVAWLLASLLSAVAAHSAATLSPQEQNLSRATESFFQQHCFDCHNNTKAKAQISLQRMVAQPDFRRSFRNWEKVLAKIGAREMPPPDEAQPTEAERQAVVKAIRGALDGYIRVHAGDPGAVAMRMLTSAEYAYTIHDLTGLDLELERLFLSESAGGEGFSNVGDVQFIQDATLERYLEAAKIVASHAVIGAGPLQFYKDPGKTGQELFAIHRINEIYRRHGFRTGAGEGAAAFGLEFYPKSFYVAWRFRHRRELGLGDVTLAHLAKEEGLSPRAAQHIWNVLNDSALLFPASEVAAAWRQLPAPGAESVAPADIRSRCEKLYRFLRDWQSTLAANSGNDEEAPVLSEHSFRPSLKTSFRATASWPKGASNAIVQISVVAVSSAADRKPIVIWRQPRVRFRQGPGPRRGQEGKPLNMVVSAAVAQQLAFGQRPDGAALDASDFVTTGSTTLAIEIPVARGATQAEFLVDAELDIARGADCLVRCVLSSAVSEEATAAASGAFSALLANPDSPEIPSWRAGVAEFARKLPQVSHREAAPSDRDPIPPPYDNSYNNPERNDFHYSVKYHRDDRFLTEHLLDDAARAQLDQAWADLLTSFDYHDTFLRFVAKKFQLPLAKDQSIAGLRDEWIETLPEEPRRYVRDLRTGFVAAQSALKAARAGHVADALKFAELAWRRPLLAQEQERLRSFYASMLEKALSTEAASEALSPHQAGVLSDKAHAEAMRALLARILVAPAFLYRIEPLPQKVSAPVALADETTPLARGQTDGPASRVALSDWELASRLSYFLWSSAPDARLRELAAAGQLSDPEELARQARRMLADPKARRLAAEFFGQWFGFYRFDEFRGIDTTRFTEFTDTVKALLYDEAVSFFEHIVREDRPVEEILFADYAFLNRELARHYQIELSSLSTNGLSRVEKAGQFHRGGLLRLGAVLAVTSAPLRTSAVKRGDWILRRVLGTPVPPPPGDAGSIPPDDVLGDGQTVRQRLEAHRREASCVNCHARIDPFGFALENFDPIGRWRETYRDGKPIETAGKLYDGTEISGLDGLDRYLREQVVLFQRTLCAKLVGYALGRSELISDRPLIDQMVASLQTHSGISGLVSQIVTSTQFRYRRTEPASE